MKKEDEELDKLWNKAMYEARRAFEEVFEKAGYDPAYWSLKLISHGVSMDFTDILETKTWDDEGKKGIKRRCRHQEG